MLLHEETLVKRKARIRKRDNIKGATFEKERGESGKEESADCGYDGEEDAIYLLPQDMTYSKCRKNLPRNAPFPTFVPPPSHIIHSASPNGSGAHFDSDK
jgi:hypothetical protein